MGLLSGFRGLHRRVNKGGISANTMVVLTSTGQRAVYYQNIEGSMNFRILRELDAHAGNMTVNQIVRSSSVGSSDPNNVKSGLNELKNAGYVRFQSDQNMEEEIPQ
jgi:hypothetical protein